MRGAVLFMPEASPEIMSNTAVERLPVPLLAVPAKQHAAERCAATVAPLLFICTCRKRPFGLLVCLTDTQLLLENYPVREILKLKPLPFSCSCVCSHLELTQ